MANAEKDGVDCRQVRIAELLATADTVDDGRSGSVVSARRRACGQGRSVEDAKQTLRQYCKVRTSRLCQPRLGGVVRTRLHQESAKTVLAHDAHWAKETELRELREENKLLKKRKDIVGVVRGRW